MLHSRPWTLIVLLAAALAPMAATAQSSSEPVPPEKTKTIYVYGGAKSWGLGFLAQNKQNWAFGIDIGEEGESRDLTGGRDSTEKGVSFNLLVGHQVANIEGTRIVPFGLIGARRYKTTCPSGQSYLGYQCYADYDPETHWKLNLGGGVMVHVRAVAVGVRVTGESASVVLGWNF